MESSQILPSNKKQNSTLKLTVEQVERFYLMQIFPLRQINQILFTDCKNPFLDKEIDPPELNKILRKMRNNKTPGPDNLLSEFYKNLQSSAKIFLLNLFNKILNSGEIPNNWSKFNQILLYKKGKQTDPLNYRGITLANAITKIFTTIIVNRLLDWATAS